MVCTQTGIFSIFGKWLSYACKLLVTAFTGGIVLSVWNLGISVNDIWFGLPFYKRFCQIVWPLDMSASNTKTVIVTFTTVKGQTIENPSHSATFTVEVYRDDVIAVEGASVTETPDGKSLYIVFNAIVAGDYKVCLKANGSMVRGFPSTKRVNPRHVCAQKTTFTGLRSYTLVLTAGSHETIKIDPRDMFGNPISRTEIESLISKLSASVSRISDKIEMSEERILFYRDSEGGSDGEVCLSFAFPEKETGWFEAHVKIEGESIGSPPLTLIVLDRNQRSRVDSFVHANRSFELSNSYFVGEIVAMNDSSLEKPRKAFCYLNSKQVSIREYLFGFIPRRTFNFRVAPATKLTIQRHDKSLPVITIQDNFQNFFEFRSADANILAACFYLILLRKIGGSESFEDKQVFFHEQLAQYHRSKNHRHTRIPLKIERFNVLDSTLKSTRFFSDHHWCHLFQIEFEGEPGIDQGGLHREWMEMIGSKLFSPKFSIFLPLEDGGHAVMPNPTPPPIAKNLNLYRFAGRIVGKCLYESSQGSSYRQHIPVRLAKSFLAQLVGLRVHYRHFADDSPQLYASKIKLIETTSMNVEGLRDLTFSEEVIDPTTGKVNTVSLKPNGASMPVTDENKFEYLRLLAEYRLSASIKEQTEQFLEGLNSLVPDSLLALFDENELELLICGVRDYKVSDLKAHHTIIWNGLSTTVVSWFWLALSNFTQEQLAKLIQFTTGSSLLPTGGFSNLKPLFQIASSGTFGNLPTAHTCFHMICLPEYRSFVDFEKALVTAITEGSEGFGFS